MSRDREIIRLDETGKKIRREVFDATNNQMVIRRNMNTSSVIPAGTTLNTITPCAACKLLRRRCAEECPFSPYFSPHEPHKFAAVHKVFGASNVSKLLLEVPENQRADAANSLVYEANLRLRDPIYGCMGVISTLQQQIQALQSELNAVRSEILKYKFGEATTNHHHHQMISSTTHSANLLSPTHRGGFVSIALPAQLISHSPPPPPPPPPPLPLPQPSFVMSSSSTSSASSLYTTSTSCTTGYSSISSDNVPFF